MDFEQEKTTALYPPVGADGGQPLSKEPSQSIAEDTAEYKTQADDLEEIMQQIRRVTGPAYLLHDFLQIVRLRLVFCGVLCYTLISFF